MRIGVAALGETVDAEVSEQFGRAPYFVIVDSETLKAEAFSNPAREMSGGAGPAAAQELANHGAEVVLAGTYGPRAEQALDAAGIHYAEARGKVRDAVTAWKP